MRQTETRQIRLRRVAPPATPESPVAAHQQAIERRKCTFPVDLRFLFCTPYPLAASERFFPSRWSIDIKPINCQPADNLTRRETLLHGFTTSVIASQSAEV